MHAHCVYIKKCSQAKFSWPEANPQNPLTFCTRKKVLYNMYVQYLYGTLLNAECDFLLCHFIGCHFCH